MSPNAGGGGSCGVSANDWCTSVLRSPNKLWKSNSIFNLSSVELTGIIALKELSRTLTYLKKDVLNDYLNSRLF